MRILLYGHSIAKRTLSLVHLRTIRLLLYYDATAATGLFDMTCQMMIKSQLLGLLNVLPSSITLKKLLLLRYLGCALQANVEIGILDGFNSMYSWTGLALQAPDSASGDSKWKRTVTVGLVACC
jgi:hypothetical protein